MTTFHHARRASAVAFAAVILTAGTAQAGEIHSKSKDGGAHAYSGSARGAVGIKDTRGDDRYVYANYQRIGNPDILSIENGNGVGTTVITNVITNVDYGHRVSGLKGCTNYNLSPDDCGPWVS